MGWGECLPPPSFQEDGGHQTTITTTQNWGEGSPQEMLVPLGRGQGVLVSQNHTQVHFSPPA